MHFGNTNQCYADYMDEQPLQVIILAMFVTWVDHER